MSRTFDRQEDESALEGILIEAGYSVVSTAVYAILESDWLKEKINEAYTRGVDDTRTNMLAPTRATYTPEPKYRRNGW